MNFRFDDTASQVYIGELTNEDISHANSIRETMRTPGWGMLLTYWSYAREAMINSGIKDSKFNEKKDLAPQKWARLDGFQEAMAIPERIIRRAEEVLKENHNDREG